MVEQLSQVYSRLHMSALASMVPFFDIHQTEKIIVEAIKHDYLHVRAPLHFLLCAARPCCWLLSRPGARNSCILSACTPSRAATLAAATLTQLLSSRSWEACSGSRGGQCTCACSCRSDNSKLSWHACAGALRPPEQDSAL